MGTHSRPHAEYSHRGRPDEAAAGRTCERPFLFFADEQRYWYEELGFPLESDALECVDCRRDERRQRGPQPR